MGVWKERAMRRHLVARASAGVILLAAIVVVALAFTAGGGRPQEIVAAQAPTLPSLPPTNPCPGCGPSGLPGNAQAAWAYPENFCLKSNAPAATYAVLYGLGRRAPGPATFFAEVQGHVRQLDTLQPGQRAVEFPALELSPGQTFLLTVWATTNGRATGQRILFGNGTTQRNATLTCDCEQQVTTTTTPISPTSTPRNTTTVPGATTTTTPISPTSTPHNTTKVGTLVPAR